MMINRRGAFVGAGAVVAGAASSQLIGSASAEETSAALPSAYQYKLGELTVTAAAEGYFSLPVDETFIPNAELGDVKEALEAEFIDTDTLRVPFTPLVIQNGSDTILFDTGFADNGPPTTGQLRNNLAAAGIQPADITKVVITHFHPDHIHGLKTKAGETIYGNAEVMVPSTEWQFWTNDANKANVGEGRQGLFDLVAGKFDGIDVTEYKWGQELVTGITAVDAHGHTPGHTAFAITSGEDRMLLLGDAVVHPVLFVHTPDWSPRFDQDADAARATRHRLLDMAASERLQVTGYHLPFPTAGNIARNGDGYRFVPAHWKHHL